MGTQDIEFCHTADVVSLAVARSESGPPIVTRNPDIARRLFLSEKTIRDHVSDIMTELGLSSRGEVIAFAHPRGMADPEA